MLAPQPGGTPTHRPGHPPAILLIEDDAALRCAMEDLLVHYGYLVVAAGTARDALAALYEPAVPPAVAVVALGLSDASGAELCAQLRERHPRLPMIACTDEAVPEEAACLLRLGVSRYFLKPVSPDELLASIEAALR